jgi:hypothetical protein
VKFPHISDLGVVAAAPVVVTVSDAIVVSVTVFLAHVHDAVCVAARVGEPDSSQATAATMADTGKLGSSSPTGALGSGSVRLQCTNISRRTVSCAN